ncbi:penicillin-binding protein activator [bacterium]|nr:penicillin-binding protein activator [bacterium]
MNMNKFLIGCAMVGLMAGCQTKPTDTWHKQYGTLTDGTTTPTTLQYGTFNDATTARRIAVLLPLTGDAGAMGRAIRTSIETATLQRGPENLSVTFYDTAQNTTTAINDALTTNPEVIIGPLFAADARTLRAMKPDEMPAISFTSDANAIGNGVMTMALMPSDGVEAIIDEIASDKSRGILILAPDTNSGRQMAAAARAAATARDITTSGLIYYREGNTDSIKDAAHRGSIYAARNAANNRAREILSDILTNDRLTAIERSSISRQLDNISKNDTLGRLPYDAVLFLGGADDAKSLAAFLRYYGLTAHDARFYGTAMWDGADISDFNLVGAKYSALPEQSAGFARIYEMVSGTTPARISSFGYDATNLAMGMLYTEKTPAAYLMNPGGYVGVDGLFRIMPTGASQRGLRVMEVTNDTPRTLRDAPTNFATPIYRTTTADTLNSPREMAVETPGINPLTYIQIPDRLQSKYKAKTYGANINKTTTPTTQNIVTIMGDDDGETIAATADFTSARPESVTRQNIDSVEIYER